MERVLQVSNRGSSAPASPIRKLVPFAQKAKERGTKIYHLNIGQPDFEIPSPIKEKLIQEVQELKVLGYANSQGEAALLKNWVEYYQKVSIELESQDLLVTTGGSEALVLSLAALLDPKDEFIVFEPFYANYTGFGHLLSNTIVPISLDETNGFHLPSMESITKAITPRTKAIMFTNPNNPTGTVFTESEVKNLLEIAVQHNLFIITDETYRGISFEGSRCVSMLEVATEEEKQHIVMVDSISKRLNLCGARIGVIASKNKEVMAAVNKFAQTRLSVSTLEQKMIVPFLGNCLAYVESIANQYQKRRDVFLAELEKELGLVVHHPEGAFYTMLTLPVEDAEDFSKWLLTDFSKDNETVMVAPGAGFYVTQGKGKKEVRVAYVLKEEELKKAAKLLAQALKEYNNK